MKSQIKLNKITKNDIVERIYSNSIFKKADIAIMADLFFDELRNAILEDNIIEIRGFGTFEVKVRKGKHNARNPKTGDVFPIEDHGVLNFRPGKEIKTAVWNLRN